MKITYNEEADVLTVEDEEYRDYDRSVELGDMSIDLASDGSPLGLVIENVAERTGLSPDQLRTVETVDITVDGEGEALRITATLHHDGDETTITGGRRKAEERVRGTDV